MRAPCRNKERLHARMAELADRLWPKYFPDQAPPPGRVARIGQLIARLSENHATPAGFYGEVQALIPRLEDWVRTRQFVDLDPSRRSRCA